MRAGLAFVLSVASVGCADAPTATLVFGPFGDPDNCVASEAAIVAGTETVWVGLRQQGVTIAGACVETADATTWADLEDALVGAGTILGDLPLGEPLEPFAMGLPGAGCPANEPSGGIRFCARTEAPIAIDPDEGGGTVTLQRICPSTSSAADCFDR